MIDEITKEEQLKLLHQNEDKVKKIFMIMQDIPSSVRDLVAEKMLFFERDDEECKIIASRLLYNCIAKWRLRDLKSE